MNIRTSYNPPPIPLREFDWSAYNQDTYDGPGCPIGYGPSKSTAIADLLTQLGDL